MSEQHGESYCLECRGYFGAAPCNHEKSEQVSNYIPSTEEVRRAYVYETPVETPAGWDEAANEAEFNRWLAQHDAEVAKATEERIINQLDDKFIYSIYGQLPTIVVRNRLIAFIKGENK